MNRCGILLRSLYVPWFVFVLVTWVSPAKTAEPIEIALGGGADSRGLKTGAVLAPPLWGQGSPKGGPVTGKFCRSYVQICSFSYKTYI